MTAPRYLQLCICSLSLCVTTMRTTSAQWQLIHEFQRDSFESRQPAGPTGIAIENGRIYGASEYPYPFFYSLNLDGSDFTFAPIDDLSLRNGGPPVLVGDSMIYATFGSNGLYRIGKDGTKNTPLDVDRRLSLDTNPIVVDDVIYGYTFQNPAPELFRMNLDGTDFEGLYVPYQVLSSNIVSNGHSLFGGSIDQGLDRIEQTPKLYIAALDGTSLSVLHEFEDDIESVRHVAVHEDTVYGIARSKQVIQDTKIFSIAADGSDFKILGEFDASETGLIPQQLEFIDDKIYGISRADQSVLFALDGDGEVEVLHRFPNEAGLNASANSDLVAIGTTLFGSTYAGGDTSVNPYGFGTIYKYETSTSVVPEPSSIAVWCLLLMMLGFACRRTTSTG